MEGWNYLSWDGIVHPRMELGRKTDNFTWKGLKKLEGWNCSLWDWIGDEHWTGMSLEKVLWEIGMIVLGWNFSSWDGIEDKHGYIKQTICRVFENWKDRIVRRGIELSVVGWDWGEKQESAGSNFPLQWTRTESFSSIPQLRKIVKTYLNLLAQKLFYSIPKIEERKFSKLNKFTRIETFHPSIPKIKKIYLAMMQKLLCNIELWSRGIFICVNSFAFACFIRIGSAMFRFININKSLLHLNLLYYSSDIYFALAVFHWDSRQGLDWIGDTLKKRGFLGGHTKKSDKKSHTKKPDKAKKHWKVKTTV